MCSSFYLFFSHPSKRDKFGQRLCRGLYRFQIILYCKADTGTGLKRIPKPRTK